MNDGTVAGQFAAFSLLGMLALAGLFYFLAKLQAFFTTIRGGEAVAIVKGDEPHAFIGNYEGHHLNDPYDEINYDERHPNWQVLPNRWGGSVDNLGIPTEAEEEAGDVHEYYDTRGLLARHLGIYFYGFYPFLRVYTYPFSWTEWVPKGEGSKDKGHENRGKDAGEHEAWRRTEKVSSFFLKDFPYFFILERAETAEAITVNVGYVITVRGINPDKALFKTDNWLRQIESQVYADIRNYVGNQEFKQLISETDARGAEFKPLSDELIRLRGKEFRDRYGIHIVKVSIVYVDPHEKEDLRVVQAIKLQFIAEQEANADVTRAGGYKKATNLRTEADVARAEQLYAIRARNPVSAQVALADAIQTQQAARTLVVNIGGGAGNTPVTVTPDDSPPPAPARQSSGTQPSTAPPQAGQTPPPA
ncbi:hypothetical protein KW782_03025 [Candidatus Parcubacteria bacterium]|nr:hypothetical protein [Candidatus Parcubacteria bacterium]